MNQTIDVPLEINTESVNHCGANGFQDIQIIFIR